MLVKKENRFEFTQDVIDEIKLSEHYSEDLRLLIIRMLTYDSSKRPSFRELLNDKIFNNHLTMPSVY